MKGSVANCPVEKEGPFQLLGNSTFRLLGSDHALSVGQFLWLTLRPLCAPQETTHPSSPILVEGRGKMASLIVESLENPLPSTAASLLCDPIH